MTTARRCSSGPASARGSGATAIWRRSCPARTRPPPDRARRTDPLAAATIGPDDLAEVVFTSGTTGDPKGAMISHRNLLSSAKGMAAVFPIGPAERLISVLPLSHLFEQGIGLIRPLPIGARV